MKKQTFFDDEQSISHPAYLIGIVEQKLILEDEAGSFYCLELRPQQTFGLFNLGDVFDATELSPLDEKSSELIRIAMKG